jgi:L-alanine-DL-glutamate epimerase-like enolase superfamily enzyme
MIRPATTQTPVLWLAEPISIDRDGLARAPERPGLGIDLDWDLIRSSVIAEL